MTFHFSSTDFQMRVYLDRSIQEVAREFGDTPEAATVTPRVADLALGGVYGPDGIVPIIKPAYGRFSFETAKWGYRRGDGVKHFELCTGQTLGYPVLVPATSIEIEDRDGPVRLTDAHGGILYVGCMGFEPPTHATTYFIPLVLEAGPDIEPYSDWQPLLIPVQAIPKPGVEAFLSSEGAGHLRKPSDAGSISVEPLTGLADQGSCLS